MERRGNQHSWMSGGSWEIKELEDVRYFSGPGSLRCGEITQPWDISTRRRGEDWSMYPMSWFQPTLLKTKDRQFTVGGTTLQDWVKAHNPKTSPSGGARGRAFNILACQCTALGKMCGWLWLCEIERRCTTFILFPLGWGENVSNILAF